MGSSSLERLGTAKRRQRVAFCAECREGESPLLRESGSPKSCDAKRCVMEAAPASPLEKGEAEFASQFLVDALEARCRREHRWACRKPLFCRRFFALRCPLPWPSETIHTTCLRANPCAVFARLHPKCRAFGSSEPGWRSWLVRTGGSPTVFFAIDTPRLG
jgi:hypothetical protein